VELFVRDYRSFDKVRLLTPESLRHVKPGILIRLLRRSIRKERTTQTELRKELGLDPPRMSKLQSKLVRLGSVLATP
jgi:hypothetical protein